MPSSLAARAAIAVAAALAVPAQAQLLTHRDISYPMARTIAEAAIDSCGAKGYPVSAVVVDRGGEVMVAMRADGAAPHTMENARRKGYTPLSFRMATSDNAKRYADDNPVVPAGYVTECDRDSRWPTGEGGRGRDRRGRCVGLARRR